MSVRRWKETGKLPVFLEHREGSFVLHSDYAELEKAAGEMAESIRGLMPHCDEPKMDGETGFERAWIRARTALAEFDKARRASEDLSGHWMGRRVDASRDSSLL